VNTLVLEVADLITHTVSASESEDSPWFVLLLGPLGAAGVYWMLYRYYRNTDKSHAFERETLVHAKPVTGNDRKVDRVVGTQRSKIKGNNVDKHRERVNRIR